jgi:hypothetical protein
MRKTKDRGAKLHFSGVPTGPDVRKIRGQWPDHELEHGDKIPYDEVASLLGCRRHSLRFRTVTWKWRKQVEKDTAGRVTIGTVPGESFIVWDDSQKHQAAVGQLYRASRAAKRSVVLSSYVDVSQLTDDERRRHDQLQVRHAAVLGALQVRGNSKSLPSLTDD